MEIEIIKIEYELPIYFIIGYDTDRDFKTINKLLMDIDGVKKLEKIISPLALVNVYKYKNGEILLVTDDDFGPHLTIKKMDNEKILESLIEIIKKIPNLDKYEPFLKRFSKWVKNKINSGIRK